MSFKTTAEVLYEAHEQAMCPTGGPVTPYASLSDEMRRAWVAVAAVVATMHRDQHTHLFEVLVERAKLAQEVVDLHAKLAAADRNGGLLFEGRG